MIKYGKFSWSDVDTMPLYELELYFEELQEMQKEDTGLEELTEV